MSDPLSAEAPTTLAVGITIQENVVPATLCGAELIGTTAVEPLQIVMLVADAEGNGSTVTT
jgi:hypothetical protein